MDSQYRVISEALEHCVLYELGASQSYRLQVDNLDDMVSFMEHAPVGTYKYNGATYLTQVVVGPGGREIRMVSAHPIAWTPTHYMPNCRPATEEEIIDQFDDVRQVERVKEGNAIAVWRPGFTIMHIEMAGTNCVFLTAKSA